MSGPSFARCEIRGTGCRRDHSRFLSLLEVSQVIGGVRFFFGVSFIQLGWTTVLWEYGVMGSRGYQGGFELLLDSLVCI